MFTPFVPSDLKARAFFYSELAKFAGADFGMDKACESIVAQSGSDRLARSLSQAMLDGVRSGKTLAEGLAGSRYPVSDLEVALVDAAERGGKLETGFRHLAEHFRQENEARRRMRRAMVYPLILLHFALVVGIGMSAMFQTLGASLTGEGSTDWKASVATGLIWVGIGYGVALGLIIAWKSLSKMAGRSAAIDRWMNRVPLAGPVRRARSLARFSEVLHLYLLSGQRMDLAWEQAGHASQSGRLRTFAIPASRRLKSGDSVTDVVADARGALPNDLVRGLASADVAGALDMETARWTEHYREEAAQNVERLAEWAPKLFYWLVLGIAAWMIIKVALSYYGIIEDMLNM